MPVCMRRHQAQEGDSEARARDRGEGPGEIGDSSNEIITVLVERGERIGTAMLSIVLLLRSILK